MSRYTCYLGPEKLKRAIWCELFVIREGYILYLEKWIKLQDQTRAEVKAYPDDNEIHSDIQHLVPGEPATCESTRKSVPKTKLRSDPLEEGNRTS